MDFFEAIDKRHCVRSFDPNKDVSDELIEKLLDSAKKAPSAGAVYPTRFTISKGEDKEKLRGIVPDQFPMAVLPIGYKND
jgi:nitroreductase